MYVVLVAHRLWRLYSPHKDYVLRGNACAGEKNVGP